MQSEPDDGRGRGKGLLVSLSLVNVNRPDVSQGVALLPSPPLEVSEAEAGERAWRPDLHVRLKVGPMQKSSRRGMPPRRGSFTDAARALVSSRIVDVVVDWSVSVEVEDEETVHTCHQTLQTAESPDSLWI